MLFSEGGGCGAPIIWLAFAILAFAVLAAYYARSYPILQDDAYISLRYADNLIHGQGLSFNQAAR